MTILHHRLASGITAGITAGLLSCAVASCGGADDTATTLTSAPAATTATTVTTGPAATTASAPTGAAGTVEIADFSFTPPTLTVAAGSTVTWTNSDKFDHSVRSSDKTFDSEHLSKGSSFSHTFATPGTYAYVCGIHNSMTGSIVVTA